MQLTKETILDAIPVDCRDGLIEVMEPDGHFGSRNWYVVYAPGSVEEATEAKPAVEAAFSGVRATVAFAGRGPVHLVIIPPPPEKEEGR